MERMPRYCVALVLALPFASAIAQPSTGNWSALRELAPGTELRIAMAAGRTVRGRLQSATAESVSVNSDKGQETIPRAEIRRVESKRGHRGRNTLIGLAIGAGGGLGVGAAVDSGNHTNWFPNFGKAVFTPLGAIIGAVVGVAISSGGWHEIYRAP